MGDQLNEGNWNHDGPPLVSRESFSPSKEGLTATAARDAVFGLLGLMGFPMKKVDIEDKKRLIDALLESGKITIIQKHEGRPSHECPWTTLSCLPQDRNVGDGRMEGFATWSWAPQPKKPITDAQEDPLPQEDGTLRLEMDAAGRYLL